MKAFYTNLKIITQDLRSEFKIYNQNFVTLF